MSNLRNGGEEIYRNDNDYRLFYYETDDQVVGYRRLYADGQPTNTFGSDIYGSPEDAATILPGLSQLLLDLS
jgi:hypothetical protein